MSPTLVYWTVVFVWLLLTLSIALRGRALVRRKRVMPHHRLMRIALYMIVLFLISYPIKVVVLGRADISSWSLLMRIVLHVHETLMITMVVAGARARWLARRWHPEGFDVARSHRRAGLVAIIAGLLGVLTAGLVLATLYQHA